MSRVTSTEWGGSLTARVDVSPNLYRRLVLATLFPIACPGCGALGAPVCARCAATLRGAPSTPPPPGLDAWAAPYAYAGVAREVVARVKYRNVRAAVPWLAASMAEALRRVEPEPAILTWAPTTARRRRDRGFDPAELLARSVARRLRVPCRALLRRAPGPPQTGLGATARKLGPRFVAATTSRSVRVVQGAVVVVDDVATTGATLAAAASALRACGATRVVGLTAARTPPPGYR